MASAGSTGRFFDGIGGFWQGLSMGNRIALGTLVVFCGFAAVYVFDMGTSEDMAVTFSGLDPQDSAKITEVLSSKQIPFEVIAGGTAIKVPESMTGMARMAAGGEGLLKEGWGYELLDETKFNRTKVEMEALLKRALEGELRRTVMSLDEVRSARVHVVMPRDSILEESRIKGSVSLTLDLGTGKRLREAQVRGIVSMVAASVESLTPEQVTVIDQEGNMLSSSSDPLMAGSEGAMKQRGQYEKSIEQKIVSMLAPVTGQSNVQVRVAADVDFHNEEKVDESYGSNAVARRTENRKESSPNNDADAEGVPGAQANGAGAGGAGGDIKETKVDSEHSKTEYMVPNQTTRTKRVRSEIKKLGVAVLVNGTYAPGAEGEEPVYTERTDEEMATITALVKGAIGFDDKRGDTVVVSQMPFTPTSASPMAEPGFMMTPDMWRAVRYAVVLILAMLLLLFLVRPLVKAVTQAAPPKAVAAESAADAQGDLNDENNDNNAGSYASNVGGDGYEAPDENTRVLAMEYANDDPRKTAQILRVWLLEDAGEGTTLPDMAAEGAQVSEPAAARA